MQISLKTALITFFVVNLKYLIGLGNIHIPVSSKSLFFDIFIIIAPYYTPLIHRCKLFISQHADLIRQTRRREATRRNRIWNPG